VDILVIDIGGTNVKLLSTGRRTPLKIPSGPEMTPRKMVRLVKDAVRDWRFAVVSIGYPGPVAHDRPIADPGISARAGSASTFAKPSASRSGL
jgi:polyphosphate glucokinase